MQRQYLYVPDKERIAVEERGAQWDTYKERWYLAPEQDRSFFQRWLTPAVPDEPAEVRYLIESDQAYVACAKTHCQLCTADIEVVAIYCVQGTLEGESLDNFSVMHITATDSALKAQLAHWPFFSQSRSLFRNVCPHCQAPQEDMDLHCEPDGAFFHMDCASRAAMTLTPLIGRIRLNGAETFEA
jgi:hypothetical protein